MLVVFWLAWQQKLKTLRHNLNYQAGDLYFAPLIPDFLMDYTRKLCPSIEPGEKPYCLYFTCKDQGRVPILILLTDQKLHYFNPYRPITLEWGAVREVGSIPLGAIAQFEVKTRPMRTQVTVNEQEFLTLPFQVSTMTANRLKVAVDMKKNCQAIETDIKETYLNPERFIDGHNLAEITNRYLDQFVPFFNFYTRPFNEKLLEEIKATYDCSLEGETPLIYLPLNQAGVNHCGVLITSENMYVNNDKVEVIPLAQVYQAGLARVNNVVYLHVNGECRGILYEEHNAFDERNTRVLQALLRVYRRALDGCKPVPGSSSFPAFFLNPDQHN